MPAITHKDLVNLEQRLLSRIDKLEEGIKEELKDSYVRKEEFNPVRSIVYGAAGLILTGVVLALIALVVMA